jgi:[ribosomal protein S5]-alanine N-acetyltransferase
MSAFLTTPRLTLQHAQAGDLMQWQNLQHEIDGEQYAADVIAQWLKQDMAHQEKHGFSTGSVYEKQSQVFIGRAGLNYLDHDDSQTDIELGYVLHKAYWGKGYATELSIYLIDWAFNCLALNKLVAVTRPYNIKSQHVLQKSGFTYSHDMQIRGQCFKLYVIYK